MMGGQRIIILKEGTEREKGKGAVFNNIAAARAVADAVKSTLGPKGMDKMLVDSLGDVTITNDGVTILKEIEIEHPTAKMLVEVAKTQDDEVGDGTTSAVILAGELLKEAESLIEQEVHPTLIVSGYRMAAAEAVKLLRELAFSVKRTDKDTLRSIARTAMSGRSVGTNADFLADIAVDAVQAIVEEVAGEVRADVDNILVQKKHGGNLTDTTLIDGIVLDKERVHPRMAKFVRDAKIALINRALEVKKTEVNEEIRIRDPAKLQMFLDEEEKTLRTMVDKIKASGANVDHRPEGLLLFIEEHLKLRRIADADLLVHFGLLDLEGAVDERDLRIAHELRHPRVDALLVEDDSIDERRVREVAAVFLLDQDVVNVRADLARDLFDDGLDRVDGDVGQEVRVRPDASTGHRGSRDRSESVLIGPLDGKGELSKEFDGLRGGHPVAVHDERRVDLLLDEALRLLEELPGQDDGARRAVADLVVLGLRDLDQHLGRRVLDLDLLQDRDPVVRDRHVAEGVDEHFVHAFRAEGRLDRVGHRASRGDVVEHRAFPLLALRPFLQDDDLLTAHHENSRPSYDRTSI